MKLEKLVNTIINSNTKYYEYEGYEIDKSSIKNDIEELCKNISVGFLTWCNKNTLLDKTKGYLYREKYYSKKDLFDIFIQNI
jgi:hypothetical protein